MPNTYIIRTIDLDDDLAFHIADWAVAFRPSSIPSEVIRGWGNLRLRIWDTEVSLANEGPDVQVDFHSDEPYKSLSEEQEKLIVNEMCESAVRYTGIPAEVIEY